MSTSSPDTRQEAHTKRMRRKEDRPGELLDAALSLFVEKGFAATRAEEVAARAGVSKGTLFLYFASKEELFIEVVRKNIVARVNEGMAELRSFQGSASEMLLLMVSEWWHRVGATHASGIAKLIIAEARNFPEIADFYQQEVGEPSRQLIHDILQRGIDQGEFRPLDMDVAINSILAPMMFVIMWKHSMAPCFPKADLDPLHFLIAHVDMLLHGILAPTSSSVSPT